ncbi:MAG: hypothetical protein EA406_01105 [Rhodospirillales bacterium]|nr:MAG: hypothetical protein EA406_01105 [Rhodospirillales bacterium]
MRAVLIGLGLISVLIGAVGLGGEPILKHQVARFLASATGFEVVIDGPVGLAGVRPPALRLADVRIQGEVAPEGLPMALTVPLMVAELAVPPMLRGRLEISRLLLTEPRLSANAGAFVHPAAPLEAFRSRSAAGTAEPAMAKRRVYGVSLIRIEADGGTLDLLDAAGQELAQLSQVTLTARRRDGPDGGFDIEADGRWEDRPVALRGSIGAVDQAGTGAEQTLRLDLDIEPALFRFDGIVQATPEPAVRGWLSGRGASFRETMAWIGTPITAPVDVLGPFAVRGHVDVTRGLASLDRVRLSLDGMQVAGALVVDLRRPRLHLKAQLASRFLDLDGYLLHSEPTATGAAPGTMTEARILPELDVDLALTARTVRFAGLEFSNAAATVSLVDRRLTLDLDEFQVYGGSGVARIVMTDSGEVPAFEASVLLNGVNTGALWADLLGDSPVEAPVSAYAALQWTGRSPQGVAESLDGSVVVRLGPGSIAGLDLVAMARSERAPEHASAQEPRWIPLVGGEGVFHMQNGLIATDDLRLATPEQAFRIAGSMDLASGTVGVRIEPTDGRQLVPNGTGTSPVEPAGASVPVAVVVQGPWRAPEVTPESDAADVAATGAIAGQGNTDEAAEDLIAAMERLPWIPVSRTRQAVDPLDAVEALQQMLRRQSGQAP